MGVEDFQKRESEIYTQPALTGIEDGGSDTDFVSPEEAWLRSATARSVLDKGEHPEQPGWMAEYQKLRAAGWPWRIAVFIAWAASPRGSRWPRTQDELAREVLGLASDRVIHTWRKKNPTIDETIALVQAAPLMAHRRDILEALIESALNPNYKNHPDRKLALEMLNDYQSKIQVDERHSGTADLSDLSEAELDRLAGRLLKGNDEQD